MTQQRILVVEDEAPIREMIAFNLTRAGFAVSEAGSAGEARASIVDRRPDLVLVDWMLPDTTGLELTRALKRDDEFGDLAVIMLTARAEERDKIAGLEGGADDYVTKPFSHRELLARIKSVLRRTSTTEGEKIVVGRLAIDIPGHRVLADDRELAMGPTEFRLLNFMMANADRVFSRSQLLDRVWGANIYVQERTVDVHIRRLRVALDGVGCADYIQTVRGAGYRFSARA